jgi:hypothetical protein
VPRIFRQLEIELGWSDRILGGSPRNQAWRGFDFRTLCSDCWCVLFCTAERHSIKYTATQVWGKPFPHSHRKVKIVDIQSKLKPALLGAVGGAIAVAIIGFSWGGWVTGSSAKLTTQHAIVASLAPICVSQFQQSANAVVRLAEMKKIGAWDQGAFVQKAGWATMPGSTEPDAAVAKACAGLINNLKL